MSKDRKRVVIPELQKIGRALAQVDQHILSAAARRRDLVILVEKRKRLEEGNQPILRREVEEKRLLQAREWGQEYGLDPNFCQALQLFIISESCRTQLEERELHLGETEEELYSGSRDAWQGQLRQNLLALTAEVAPQYDEMYGDSAPFATQSYVQFEENRIRAEIETLKAIHNVDLALDIGCATGRMTFQLAPHFSKVVGVDVSPDMVRVAKDRASEKNVGNVSFELTDVEGGLPIEPHSVSLALMNLGTASDIHNTRQLLTALNGVLKKDGRFLLSFYNQNAFYYQCPLPWKMPLVAEIDTVRHCLDVSFNRKTFRVFARPYSPREIRDLLEKIPGLTATEIVTYPTMGAVLPNECFADEQSREIIRNIDRRLLDQGLGAYILVTGRNIK